MAVNSWKFSLVLSLASLCFAPLIAQSQTLTFLPKVDYPTQGGSLGLRPYAVATGDLNGDTYPDIISVNANSNNISVFLNNGDGTFVGAVNYSMGNTPRSLVIAELNGDAHLDVAVANNATSTVAVRFGTGTGTFGASTAYPVGGNPTAIAAGDVNNDGFRDLVTVGSAGVQSVLINNGITGAGTFQTALNSNTDPATAVVLADFDGDNILDIALTTTAFDRISVSKGVGNGTFDAMPALALPTGGALGIRAVDIDSDQILDLLTANTGNGLQGTSSFRKGEGTAEFTDEGDASLGLIPIALELTDLDGDEISDVIYVSNSGSELSLGRGNGDGTFGSLQDFATGTQPNGVALADVNQDGKADLITANFGANSISVLINTTPVAGYSVSGRVLLQQTEPSAVELIFTFTPQDGSTIFTRTITTDATGGYTYTAIPPKVYTVGIKGAKWLRSSLVADATAGSVIGLNTTLRGGDASDDNAVDIADLLMLINAYNKTTSNAGYSEAADFNNDGSNDIADLNILISNYNTLGSP